MTPSSNNIEPEKIKPSQLIKGSATMATANFLTLVLGLAIAMVATRKFTADVYGSFILLYLVSTFLTQVSTLGLGIAVTKFLATTEDPRRKELLTNTTLTIRLIMTGIFSLIAVALAPLIFKFIGANLETSSIFYMVIFFFCDSITYTLQSVLQGLFRFQQIAIWNFSSSLLNLGLLFLLSLLPINGLAILVFARWIAYILAGIYMFFSIPTKKHFVLQIDLVKELVKFGFPLQLNDILSYFYNRIDTIMIAVMLGSANVAYFEIARKIPDSFISFFEAFRVVFFPTFSRLYAANEKFEAELLLKSALRLTTFSCLLIASVAFLFGKDIINVIFSSQYVGVAPAFVIMTISMNFILIGYLLGNSLVAVGESDKPAKINVVHAIISLGSNLLLIPPLGILGAAITRIIGPIVTNPLNYIFLYRKFSVHVLAAYLKPILIFTAWIGLAFLIPQETILPKIMALVGFIFINYIFSVITKDDFTFLRLEAGKLIKKPFYKLG